jgi:hypothetical protein
MAGEHELAYSLEPGDRVGVILDGCDTGQRGIVRSVSKTGVATVDPDNLKKGELPITGTFKYFFRIGEDGPADGGAA